MNPPDPKASAINVPVFALAADADWLDWENAFAASVNFQANHRPQILPLMLFAPLTEPANPDTWEPMTTLPDNLLACSIERTMDATLLKALAQAEPVLGEIRHTASFPAISINLALPLADVYRQMTVARIQAYTLTKTHPDDVSCFFCAWSGGRAGV
jgi:hypothetical protein